jgi:hypothetical protein
MGSNGHTANRTPTATTRQPLPSGATEYRLSTLPRHHSCSFCAPSTNVDAGAAIHSLTRCVASCTPFVLRLTCDCPSVLAPSRPYPLVHSHYGRRRIHHGANIATIGRATTTTIPPHLLYIYAANPSDKPLPLSPLFKPCPSQTQGAPPTHTHVSCHAHGTLVAHRTPAFLEKTPSPATSRTLLPASQNYRPCRSFSCSLVVSSRPVTTISRTTLLRTEIASSFWLPNSTHVLAT